MCRYYQGRIEKVMFARVHTSTEVKGNNLGSCHSLAKYLDKEAEQENVSGKTLEDRETSSRLVHYLDKEEGNNFFSSQPGVYDMGEVITNIDANVKHLHKDDTKFYMLTLNPSVAEQKHLIGKDIEDFHSLSKEEQDEVKAKLVDFTREAMDDYARNFARDNIKSGDDLLYYARIETQRTYKKASEEVRSGLVKAGTLKPGLNLHVHIIVSRNSKDQKTKLSPLVKSKGNDWKLNGAKVRRGFNHEQWKVDVQNTFNNKFNYRAPEKDVYLPKDNQSEDKKRENNKKETFKEWFGTYASSEPVSKVVDSWGVPVKVYHSTVRKGKKKFQNFNMDKPVWFTPSKEYSKRYYSRKRWYQKGDTYAVYLNLKNPIHVGDIDRPLQYGLYFHRNDWYNELSINSGIPYEVIEERLKPIEAVWIYEVTNTAAFKEMVQEYGYDGIKAEERGFVSYAAFHQEQIRNASESHFQKKDYVLPEKISEKEIVDLHKVNMDKIVSEKEEKKAREQQAKDIRYKIYQKEYAKKEKERASMRFNPDKVVGSITTLNGYGIDTVSYNSRKDFLKDIERMFKTESHSMSSFEILDNDPSFRKAVDDAFCKSAGSVNDTAKEWYVNHKGFNKVRQQEFCLKDYVGGIILDKNMPDKYTYFKDKTLFIETLEESMEKGTWVEYKIFSLDSDIRKPVDDMLAKSYGFENKRIQSQYEEMSSWRIEKIGKGRHYSAIPVREVNKSDFDLKVEKYSKDRERRKVEYNLKATKKNKGQDRSKQSFSKGATVPGLNKIKQKAKKEILQDNFQTERAIIGQTAMVVRTLSNPVASVRQAIIREIKNMLNPVKEL